MWCIMGPEVVAHQHLPPSETLLQSSFKNRRDHYGVFDWAIRHPPASCKVNQKMSHQLCAVPQRIINRMDWLKILTQMQVILILDTGQKIIVYTDATEVLFFIHKYLLVKGLLSPWKTSHTFRGFDYGLSAPLGFSPHKQHPGDTAPWWNFRYQYQPKLCLYQTSLTAPNSMTH